MTKRTILILFSNPNNTYVLCGGVFYTDEELETPVVKACDVNLEEVERAGIKVLKYNEISRKRYSTTNS